MKKSIAFLGALLFGSVTFGQVTKNDSIKKPASRKVSADDMKNFPTDSETTMSTGDIKGESFEKQRGQQLDAHVKFSRTEKHSSDASAGKGSMTQKGRENKILVTTTEKQTSDITTAPISNFKGGAIQKANADKSGITTEKQHYTVKLSNANKKAATDGVEPLIIKEGATTTQKKHVSNVKWTPGKVSIGNKVAVDSTSTQNKKSTPTHLKGGMIQKSNTIEKTPLIEKMGGSSSTQTTGSTDVFIKIGDIKGEKDDK